MITKEKLIESIKSMPEDSFEDMDTLLDRIILLDKIENGITDIKEGNVISNEEMKSVIDSWFKK
jgi:predicted transcriptional regulator